MKNALKMAMVFLLAFFVLAACSEGDEAKNGSENANDESETNDEKLRVVSSFSILTDMVTQIGGERVTVHNLVPIGTDPHEYEPLPEDIKAATDADLLLYNGLNLEGGEAGWFFKLIDAVGQEEDVVFTASQGVEPMYMTSEDGKEEEINPHAFLDPAVGMQMAENVRDALMAVDPDYAEAYEKNAEEYLNTLKAIDEEYAEKVADIPEEQRILVTSERAYQYMADHYGLEEGYIWAVDTEENGSPEQIMSLVELIKEKDVPVLFVESNVDPRPMETVSKETGVEIASDKLYSDEIGEPGEEGDTYVKYLKYNIDTIHKYLAK